MQWKMPRYSAARPRRVTNRSQRRRGGAVARSGFWQMRLILRPMERRTRIPYRRTQSEALYGHWRPVTQMTSILELQR